MNEFANMRLLGAAAIFAIAGHAAAAAVPKPVYKDPHAPVEARVEDLLSRMTLDEKVAQMLSIWDEKVEVFDAKLEFDPAKMAQKYPHGVGQFARPSDATGPKSPRGGAVAAIRAPRSGWSMHCNMMRWSIHGWEFPSCFTRKACTVTRHSAPPAFPRPLRWRPVGTRPLLREVNGGHGAGNPRARRQ